MQYSTQPPGGATRGRLQRFRLPAPTRLVSGVTAAFEEAVFLAFLAEADPMWMAFLQNLLAADPRRRHAPVRQDRFARLALGR